MKTQIIEKLECNICKNDNYLYNYRFYICSCKKYSICPLSANSHDQTHKMIEYKDRFYKCVEHNKYFISYCNNYNINLCEKCEKNHNNMHKRISYNERKPNKKNKN